MKKWVQKFFQEPNGWDINQILGECYNNSELKELFHELLLLVQSDKVPVVLPRLDDEKRLWFYIVGKDVQQLAELRAILKAYLDDTYVVLDPIEYRSSNDPIERVLIDNFSAGFLRLHIHRSVNEDKNKVFWIISTLNKVISQYHERPLMLSVVKRPTGRILRDFFTACNHNDYDSAGAYYDELENRQLLSKRNLISLEYQALAAGHRWKSIVDHSNMQNILSGRIPRRIVAIILRAIRETTFATDEFTHLELEDIRRRWFHLDTLFFRVPDIAKSSDLVNEWKCWAIGAAAFGYRMALEVLPEYIDRGWKEQLTKWAALNVSPSESEHSGISLEALLQESPSAEIAAVLLKESLTVDADCEKRIYEKLIGYPNALKDKVFSNKGLRQVWEGLEAHYSDRVRVTSWPALFAVIADPAIATDAIRIAMEQSDYWEADKWDEQAFESVVSSGTNENVVLRDILPILLPWLETRNLTPSVGCIEQLLLIMATDTYISVQDIVLCSDLMNCLTGIPHTREQYITSIDAIWMCWDKVKSKVAVDAALGVMDCLIDAPCADPQRRESLWRHFQEFLIKDWLRLDRQQKVLVRQFAIDLTGSDEQFPDVSTQDSEFEADLAANLEGKKLAIYTLTEGAGKRARAVLELLYPGLIVILNHDKTATSALKSLAENADYFVFSAKSATHQAFNPVTQRRNDLIYPSGKGTTSIVRAFARSVTNA